jgi:hypothetical protein
LQIDTPSKRKRKTVVTSRTKSQPWISAVPPCLAHSCGPSCHRRPALSVESGLPAALLTGGLRSNLLAGATSVGFSCRLRSELGRGSAKGGLQSVAPSPCWLRTYPKTAGRAPTPGNTCPCWRRVPHSPSLRGLSSVAARGAASAEFSDRHCVPLTLSVVAFGPIIARKRFLSNRGGGLYRRNVVPVWRRPSSCFAVTIQWAERRACRSCKACGHLSDGEVLSKRRMLCLCAQKWTAASKSRVVDARDHCGYHSPSH